LAVLFTIPRDWFGLIFVRLFQGVASAMVWPVAEALVVDSSPPERRGKALSAYMVTSNTGFAVGPFVGGGMMIAGQSLFGLSLMDSYRLPFYFTALLALVTLVFIAVRLRDMVSPSGDRKKARKAASPPLPRDVRRSLNVLYANSLVNGFAMGMIAPLTALFMAEHFFPPGDAHAAALISAAIGFAGIVGLIAAVPAGIYSDRHGRKPPILFGGYTARACTLFMPLAPSFTAISGLLIGRGLAFNVVMPSMRALQADLIPVAVRGRLLGFIQTLFNLGAVIGPIIGGALYSIFYGTEFHLGALTLVGEGAPFFLSGCLGFITISMVALFVRETRARTR
ncbi:MAG: MFS transporter, partial [Candidatus Thermoplasmatota archaeon]